MKIENYDSFIIRALLLKHPGLIDPTAPMMSDAAVVADLILLLSTKPREEGEATHEFT